MLAVRLVAAVEVTPLGDKVANNVKPPALAHVGAPEPPDVRTCPEVPADVYACAVPVPYPTPPAVAVAVELVPPLAIGKTPVTPVVKGSPVALVNVPLEGVPKAPPLTTKAPALPVFTPKAVVTPVPVEMVEGAAPAPPPTTIAFAAKAAEVAQVDALEKYGMPPDVPATVSAKVPLVVIGEPETEIKPPVKDWPTEVTVPPPPPVALKVPVENDNPEPMVTLLKPPEPLPYKILEPLVAGA